MAASLSEQEKRDLRFVFNVYDPKNDGVISADDVIRAMSALGFAQSREVVESMISQLSSTSGKRGTGVNIEEFFQIVSSCQGDAFDFHEEITKGFLLMDKDKDGFISLNDLKTLCKELDVALKDDELDDMIYEADLDGDGKVNQEEFVKMMLRTCLYNQQV